MIINEEMARRHWPNENPIGRRVTMKDWGPPLTGEIVGVVSDVKADGLDSSTRSEEHTSELQSLRHLVCRLLLEKKKKRTTNNKNKHKKKEKKKNKYIKTRRNTISNQIETHDEHTNTN